MMWLPYHRSPSFARKRKQRVQEEEFPSWLMPQPDTTHIGGENVHINGLEIGHSSIQGYRQSMEDQHIITKLSLANHTLVAILDGHAGEFAAKFAASMLAKHIERTKSWKDYCAQSVSARSDATGFLSSALVSAYMSIDEEMKELDLEVTSGSTLVCSIITPSHIITANVGDSRCVIGCSNRTVIDMTEDHKPSLKEEKARIVAAGGFVMMDRVNGELAMSRALGDFQYKLNDELDVTMQMVTCVPDIAVHKRSAEDALIILACDGVWDVMSNVDAVMFLQDIVMNDPNGAAQAAAYEKLSISQPTKSRKKGESDSADSKNRGAKKENDSCTAQMMAEALVDVSLSAGSTDNISAVIVKF